MVSGDTWSRVDKIRRARSCIKTGDFSYWYSGHDWGFYPSHKHWRKVDLRYRKPKTVK